MKISIGPMDIQVRTQTRIVTTTDLMYKGEVVASGEATVNSIDDYDEEKGTRLSACRALENLAMAPGNDTLFGVMGIFYETFWLVSHLVLSAF